MLHTDTFRPKSSFLHQRFIVGVLFVLVLLTGACVAPEQVNTTAPEAVEEAATNAEAQSVSDNMAENVIAVDPLALEQAVPPVSLAIPAIGLATAVESMGWTVTEEEGNRTTKWAVPESAAGWHVNSAGAGSSGNMILSGHQLQGEAVFAPISLGDVEVGQQVLVEDEAGVTFVYEVLDVSEPIPASGASAAEQEAALAYLSDDGEALLTLITGWPDFTTTHRVFVQAALAGVQK